MKKNGTAEMHFRYGLQSLSETKKSGKFEYPSPTDNSSAYKGHFFAWSPLICPIPIIVFLEQSGKKISESSVKNLGNLISPFFRVNLKTNFIR